MYFVNFTIKTLCDDVRGGFISDKSMFVEEEPKEVAFLPKSDTILNHRVRKYNFNMI